MQVVHRNQEKETKSYFGAVLLIAILLSTTFVMAAFMGKKQEPTYTIKATLKFWQVTVDCLKQSNAPSATTNQLIDEISKQIDPILQQEQKVADSINKSKVKPKQ